MYKQPEMESIENYFLPEFAVEMPILFSGNYGGGYVNNYMNDNSFNPPILSLLPDVVDEFVENDDYILTAGNARPLDQALQHATTELIHWLEELGLEKRAAHILLGQCVEYDVGNVYDPAYTMICKIKKSISFYF